MKIREVLSRGWRLWLDLGKQELAIETPDPEYASFTPANDLQPIPRFASDQPVSAATLILKAKQFDDGLMAAVELAMQAGLGRFPSKAELLRELARSLGETPAAMPLLAACLLGDVAVAVPDSLASAVQISSDEFLRDELRSEPMAFYRWSRELETIFRQDRFLQTPLKPEQADAIVAVLGSSPKYRDAHAALLRLAARLTNPFRRSALDAESGEYAFLPPSESNEVTLFEKLYRDRPIPKHFDLMTELIRQIHAGSVKLEPTAESGWYDHQTWSLEPLILLPRTPEGIRHRYGPRYRKQLEELFRGTLALMRETHVKQGGGGRGGYGGPTVQPIRVTPDLTLEPLPTMYARRAASYRFVRSVLDEAFGCDWEQLHRLTREGPVALPLGQELTQIERIFDGAAAVSSYELGLEPGIGNPDASRDFLAWRAKLASDRDIAQDTRMMVPVFFDIQRRKTKVWAVLGWRTTSVTVSYCTPPEVMGGDTLEEAAAGDRPPVLFMESTYQFVVPVMVEFYITRLLDRDEFRKHCDRYRTEAAILRNLRVE